MKAPPTNMNEKKREYMRLYRERNRDKLLKQRREWMAKFRDEHPEVIKERKKRDYKKHRKKRIEKQKKYRTHHPETMERWRRENKEEVRQYRKRYNSEHKKEQLEYNRRWRSQNRDKHRLHSRNYWARKRSASVGRVSLQEWQEAIREHNSRCAYCGLKAKLTMDHIIPLSRGGLHCLENIVPACTSCNSKKGTKSLLEWYPEMQVADRGC